MLKQIRGWSRRRKMITGIGLLAVMAFAAFAVWLLWDLPPIDRLQAGMTLPSTRIYDRNNRLIYEILSDSDTGGLNTAIPLETIPLYCRQATIAVEDANFYSHPG
ncbi:MAG: putative penicillin-binding protein, partial [Chloroflexi bacterium OLB15]